MRNLLGLHVVQMRANTLYAHMDATPIFPLILVSGLLLWLLAVSIATGIGTFALALVIGMGALAILILSPMLLFNGSWLTIDRDRGWIHWRACRWPRRFHESFSPQRIDQLSIIRRGWTPPGLGMWEIVLTLDHPRLAKVVLGRTLRLKTAASRIRRLSATIETNWLDHKCVEHQEAPLSRKVKESSWHGIEWIEKLPPPPDIEVRVKRGRTLFVLHGTSGLHDDEGAFLIYAILWNLWAWSSLIIEWRAFGPMRQWDTAQNGTIALIVGGGLAGLAMLIHALLRFMGPQVLEMSARGWVLSRLWLKMNWGRRSLNWRKHGWVRRIDPPSPDAGLWVPDRQCDIRLGAGLSADSLAWLHQTLTRGEQH